jgi:predicted lipid-binding transport protein (Tim44 family)
MEIAALAVIALIVILRLYSYLGRRTGAEPPPASARAGTGELPQAPGAPAKALPANSAREDHGGVADIVRADPSFEASHFLEGARKAYEMIVQAFAAGDRDALRPLLTPRVFESYVKAIDERQTSGGKGPELVRLKSADLAEAELDGVTARVSVKFEAELAEGEHGLRDTKELWTFERDTTSRDPNWRLAGVAQA